MRLPAIAAVAVALTGVTSAFSSPAVSEVGAASSTAVSQDAPLVTALSYNICGAVCGSDGDTARAVAGYLFVAENAASLSVQEICHDQWERLFDDISDATSGEVTSVFVASRLDVDRCDGVDLRFGNAVITRGSSLDYDVNLLTNPDLGDPGCRAAERNVDHSGLRECAGLDCWNPRYPSVECRTSVCNRASVLVGEARHDVVVCSSHLTNGSDVVAQVQADDYLWVSALHSEGVEDRWIAGDFNLEPAQLPPGYGEPWVNLVDGPTISSRSPSSQIDHIFTRSPVADAATPTCEDALGLASDHCFSSGQVGFG